MSVTDAGTNAGPGPEKAYFDALRAGKFRIQRCGGCGRHVFYPRAACPHCGAFGPEWVDACGRGTVYSTSVVRRKPEDGGDYNVALVDLEEGPRMMSRVDGIAPTAVRIGMAVTVKIVQENGNPVVVWVPAEGRS